jgi:hypothetical protein
MADGEGSERGGQERGIVGTVGVLLASAALAVALCFGYVFLVEPKLSEVSEAPGAPTAQKMATPWIVHGLDRPPAVAAAEADLEPDDEVIGVLAGGKSRAYLVTALRSSMHHVVNDVLGSTPVSVTYCDRTECVRVFTGPADGRPLPMSQAGWNGEALMLRYGTRFYMQPTGQAAIPDAEPIPCPTLPTERTTWKAWRAAHPDTDVFVGVLRDGPD